MIHLTKGINFELKDVDTSGRRVKFAAAKFGNVDSDGDVILRGAFAKSIKERGPLSEGNRKIKHLRYHDFEHEIGIIKSIEETHDHLLVESDLGRSSKGEDAFLDYQDGIITEHSIGFMLIQDKINFNDSGIRELKEVMLMETSAVTFGANSETPVFGVSGKDMLNAGYLDRLNKQMSGYIQALKNGKGTDDRLEAIENNLKVIQSKYNSLIDLSRTARDTQNDKPKNDPGADKLKQFILSQI